jgi:hypothetical protein
VKPYLPLRFILAKVPMSAFLFSSPYLLVLLPGETIMKMLYLRA